MRLTKTAVEKAKYTGKTYGKGKNATHGRCVYSDDEIPGFALRVLPSGRKTFILRYRTTGGQERLFNIGDFPSVTADKARARAMRLRSEVLDGADPQADKEHRRESATVKVLCRDFLKKHSKARKATWKKDERQFNKHVIPAWGSRKLSSITRADVSALHRKIGARTPIEANRTLALIRKAFNMAVTWGLLDEGHPNPATGIEMYPETSRDVWVRPDELPALLAALGAEPNVYIRSALLLILLTGCRRTEILSARWDQIDLERRELRLSATATKARRAHTVFLSQPAVEVLKAIPQLENSPFVFPSPREGKPMLWIDGAWRRIRERAGMPTLRIHDLRRSFGSMLATSGTSLVLIGRLLNHSSPATTAVYSRLAADPLRDAVESIGRQVAAAAPDAKPADVLALSTARGA